ncbi:MAG: hypothetical protein EOP10_03910 [Proteobacteria bacterium]|nr:MAG: hypothetical protein EOP10_03910 [Pseudomonadota bacterium]
MRHNRNFDITAFGFAACLTMMSVSCGKKDSDNGNGLSFVRLGGINISDAKQLFVTGSNTLGLTQSGGTLKSNTLYKVTADGVIQEVSYTDENNQTITE